MRRLRTQFNSKRVGVPLLSGIDGVQCPGIGCTTGNSNDVRCAIGVTSHGPPSRIGHGTCDEGSGQFAMVDVSPRNGQFSRLRVRVVASCMPVHLVAVSGAHAVVPVFALIRLSRAAVCKPSCATRCAWRYLHMAVNARGLKRPLASQCISSVYEACTQSCRSLP